MWLLTQILTPLLNEVPSHLKSSDDLMSRIKAIPPGLRAECSYPFSLDVEALYTSIPPNEATRNIEDMLEAKQFSCCGLTATDIGLLLKAVLQNVFFAHGDHLYKQVNGLAMGASVSGILAITFMHSLEKNIVASGLRFALYARYVDDVFMLTTNRDEAERIVSYMNNLHSGIRFTVASCCQQFALPA